MGCDINCNKMLMQFHISQVRPVYTRGLRGTILGRSEESFEVHVNADADGKTKGEENESGRRRGAVD